MEKLILSNSTILIMIKLLKLLKLNLILTLIKDIFFTKLKDWEYENEYRIGVFSNTETISKGVTISEIIFGYKCNKKDIDLVKKQTQNIKNIKYFKYIQNKNNFEYKILS